MSGRAPSLLENEPLWPQKPAAKISPAPVTERNFVWPRMEARNGFQESGALRRSPKSLGRLSSKPEKFRPYAQNSIH